MTILEALERAKSLKKERHERPESREQRRLPMAGDTATLRVLHEGVQAEPEPESEPMAALGRLEVDPEACERNRILYLDEQIAQEPRGAAAYRMLRGRMRHRALASNWSALGITSPGPGEGKTVTTLNVAISIAREKQRTVYVLDLDMRAPKVMQYLGVNPPGSLSAYFSDALTAAEVLFETDMEKLIVAGATEPSRDASELLATSRLDELMLAIRRRSPDALILIDLPPVTSTDEALVVAPRVDALFLVATEGRTRRDALVRSIDLLSDFLVAGIILNRSSEESGDDYYAY